jgi:hypothetical protein
MPPEPPPRPVPSPPPGSAAVLGDWENGEAVLSLKEAAKDLRLCRNGRRPHISTIHRWASEAGYRGVRLEVAKTPRGIATSAAAIGRFLARLNGADVPPMTPAAARRQHTEAMRELAEAGI